MLEKIILNKSTEVDLALPDDGFSPDFISALSGVCSENKSLSEGYLVLKKEGEDISLLLGLVFFDHIPNEQQEASLEDIMTKTADLFSDEISIEAICLNNNTQLKQAITSMDSLFYSAI